MLRNQSIGRYVFRYTPSLHCLCLWSVHQFHRKPRKTTNSSQNQFQHFHLLFIFHFRRKTQPLTTNNSDPLRPLRGKSIHLMVIISSASACTKYQASRTVARRIAIRREQHAALSLPHHHSSSRAYSYLSYHANPSQRNDFSGKKILDSNTKLGGTTVSVRQFSSGKRDFYDVLSVSKGSDKGTIKKAYFKLAKKYHPDTNKVCTSAIIIMVDLMK